MAFSIGHAKISTDPATTMSVKLPEATKDGDMVVVLIKSRRAIAPPVRITDAAGNHYDIIKHKRKTKTGKRKVFGFVAKNVQRVAVVTATFNSVVPPSTMIEVYDYGRK